ncbi:MAG: hypothetical protein QXK65_01755 [Candidatus Micrarchaeaceae archaeon]
MKLQNSVAAYASLITFSVFACVAIASSRLGAALGDFKGTLYMLAGAVIFLALVKLPKAKGAKIQIEYENEAVGARGAAITFAVSREELENALKSAINRNRASFALKDMAVRIDELFSYMLPRSAAQERWLGWREELEYILEESKLKEARLIWRRMVARDRWPAALARRELYDAFIERGKGVHQDESDFKSALWRIERSIPYSGGGLSVGSIAKEVRAEGIVTLAILNSLAEAELKSRFYSFDKISGAIALLALTGLLSVRRIGEGGEAWAASPQRAIEMVHL